SGIAWATYGLGAARTRALEGVGLRPPFRRVWTWHGRALLEFPPVVARGRLFLATFDGRFYALDARTGRAIWRYDSGRCGWASPQPRLGGLGSFYSTPALDYDRVYVGSTDGKVYSFGAETGALRWSRPTGGYVYASPAVWQQLVLVGSYSHQFFALNAATGR